MTLRTFWKNKDVTYLTTRPKVVHHHAFVHGRDQGYVCHLRWSEDQMKKIAHINYSFVPLAERNRADVCELCIERHVEWNSRFL